MKRIAILAAVPASLSTYFICIVAILNIRAGLPRLRALRCVIAIPILLSLCLSSSACSFSMDCSPGSACIKPSGSTYSVCAAVLLPGNSYAQEPVPSPLDVNGTFGNSCSFDTDCGPTSHCSGIYGTCAQ